MHELIQNLVLPQFNNPILKELSDSARLNYKENIAFTTDSFVVNPLFFRGGDIGKLAVCGTVNDLVMLGAVPEYLSLGLIIEEGLSLKLLRKVVVSIASSAKRAGVTVATGDLKVVERGACDKLFINTSGVGRILPGASLSAGSITPADKIIISRDIGRHGLAVLSGRKGLELDFDISSDCAPLDTLLLPLLKGKHGVKFMRDPTRGGVAATLNEVSGQTGLGAVIEERRIPVNSKVRAACELLGIDPLHIANEGAALLITSASEAQRVRDRLRRHPLGRNAEIIGEVVAGPRGRVVLETVTGSRRIVDMPQGEALPRIC
jgi:hydrogenase expression/formation protein HypE